jgi:uncharacterized protein (DUF433 family)
MQFHFITTNPGILGGKPIVSGPRISGEIILEWLATAGTVEEIYRQTSICQKRSVEEAIMYAAQPFKNENLNLKVFQAGKKKIWKVQLIMILLKNVLKEIR